MRPFLFALSFLCVIAPGCNKKPEVSFTIDVPSDVDEDAAWYEIGAIRDGDCALLAPQLSGGIPATGTQARVAFRKGEAAPAMGDLPAGKYAFVATARNEKCAVLAGGCERVDVTDKDSVTIALGTYDPPEGACSAGTVCQSARCVPALDTASPNIGAACSLEVVGAGPLANALGGEISRSADGAGTRLSAPSIVSTPDGFIIGYREAANNASRIRLALIDNSGGTTNIQKILQQDGCTPTNPDSVGLGFTNGKGMVLVGQQSCPPITGCNAGTGNVVYSALFDAQGQVVGPTSGKCDLPKPVAFSQSHAVAPFTNGRYLVTSVVSDQGRLVVYDNNQDVLGYDFGGSKPIKEAWVSTSPQAIGLLALATPQSAPPPGGTTGDTVLRLQLADINSDLNLLPLPTEFRANWGSIAMAGQLGVVVSDGEVGTPVRWQIFERSKLLLNASAGPNFSGGFGTEGPGPVSYADVAVQGDRMFIAVERGGSINPEDDTPQLAGSISLVAFDNISKAPVKIREVVLARDPRIAQLKRVRDGLIAVAANEKRVVVAWMAARVMEKNDTVGGYAVFACTP